MTEWHRSTDHTALFDFGQKMVSLNPNLIGKEFQFEINGHEVYYTA